MRISILLLIVTCMHAFSLAQHRNIIQDIGNSVRDMHMVMCEAEVRYKSVAKDDTTYATGSIFYHFAPEDSLYGYSFLIESEGRILAYDFNRIYVKQHKDSTLISFLPEEEYLFETETSDLQNFNFIDKASASASRQEVDLQYVEELDTTGKLHILTLSADSVNLMVNSLNIITFFDPLSMLPHRLIKSAVIMQVMEQYKEVRILSIGKNSSGLDRLAELRDEAVAVSKLVETESEYASEVMYEDPYTPGDFFPDFILKDMEGNTSSLYDRGKPLYFIDFWYTTCAPCLQSYPVLHDLYEEYKENMNIEFLALNGVDKDIARLEKFFSKNPIPYKGYLVDPTKRLQAGITAHPSFLLLDKDFKVLYYSSGYHDDLLEVLKSEVNNALAGIPE